MDKEHVEGTYEDAKGRVKGELGGAVGDRGLQAEGIADRLEGEAGKRVGDIKDAVSDAAGSAQEALRPLTKEIGTRIQRNPTGAVLMAAGAGLLLALLMGRR
jgi:uncharacterized protein YjbJ (UPF0337 family)